MKLNAHDRHKICYPQFQIYIFLKQTYVCELQKTYLKSKPDLNQCEAVYVLCENFFFFFFFLLLRYYKFN